MIPDDTRYCLTVQNNIEELPFFYSSSEKRNDEQTPPEPHQSYTRATPDPHQTPTRATPELHQSYTSPPSGGLAGPLHWTVGAFYDCGSSLLL